MRNSIFARSEEVKERADDSYFTLVLNSQKVRFFWKLAMAAKRIPVYTDIDAPQIIPCFLAAINYLIFNIYH